MRIATITRLTALFVAALIPCAVTAHAQKPALTQNIDEKGRVPYHSFFSTSATSPVGQFFAFRQVPAGYRLVVTHVSVLYPGFSSGSTNYVELTGGAPAPGETQNAEYLPAPVSVGPAGTTTNYVVSSPVTYYVEPLGTPSIFVTNTLIAEVVSGSLSGYLVALN